MDLEVSLGGKQKSEAYWLYIALQHLKGVPQFWETIVTASLWAFDNIQMVHSWDYYSLGVLL